MLRAALAALALSAGAAAAQDRACLARVDHQDIPIAAGAILEAPETGLREWLLSAPGRAWSGLRGRLPACDSATTLAFLAGIEGLDPDIYCLAEAAEDGGFLLVPGERNWRGRCRRTFCDRVGLTAEDGAAVLSRLSAFVTGRASPAEGAVAFAAQTGAMALTGRGGLMAEVLGGTASALGSALAAPGVAAAAAVTVIGAGGAVYLCREG